MSKQFLHSRRSPLHRPEAGPPAPPDLAPAAAARPELGHSFSRVSVSAPPIGDSPLLVARDFVPAPAAGVSPPVPSPPTAKEDPNAKKLADIKAVLNASPTGVEALKMFDEYKMHVDFKPGGGSYYDTPATMVVDSGESATVAALTFVHEMNHAKYDHEKKTANLSIGTLSREEYIKKMVEEEAEGTVKSIEAKIELEGGGKVDVSNATFPLEKEYRAAYKAALDAAKAKDPTGDAAAAKAAARIAGKDRVTEGFMKGEVVTSNTNAPYSDYYGQAWDNANKDKVKKDATKAELETVPSDQATA